MTAKVRMSLQEGVIELEGSEEFVERQLGKIETLIELFKRSDDVSAVVGDYQIGANPVDTPDHDATASKGQSQALSVPESFGEWMHKFRDDIGDQQKALVASFYVQSKSATNDFKTIEVSNCLKDHGIKIANPSTAIQRLATKKHTFQTRKVGKLIYMRVSKDGEAHLKEIFR